jgi:hypothetical protein
VVGGSRSSINWEYASNPRHCTSALQFEKMFSIKDVNEKVTLQEFIEVKKLVPHKKYLINYFERYTTKFGDRILLTFNEGIKCFLPQRFNNALTDQHLMVYNNAIQEKTKNYFVVSEGPIGKTTLVTFKEEEN